MRKTFRSHFTCKSRSTAYKAKLFTHTTSVRFLVTFLLIYVKRMTKRKEFDIFSDKLFVISDF